MAIEKNKILSWTDIQTLYTNLNTARTKFGMSTVSVPDNPGTAKPSSISNLNDLVNAMKSNKYLTNVAITGVTVPNAGTLIYPLEFSKISSTINSINNTCAFDSFTPCSCVGFSFNDCSNHHGSGHCAHCSFNVCPSFCEFGFNDCFSCSFCGFNKCNHCSFVVFSGFCNRYAT